ncbi:MAG TPA: YCF48-related protein [Pyrinomonadaceae bacterium]|nr:YCF48-related protein [Pyrinomonadaceae bacterium]
MRRRDSTAGVGGRVRVTRRGLSAYLATRPLTLAVLFVFCLDASAQTSWKKQQTGTFAWLHSVFFVDESRGWAVGGKGALLATTDGGEHWELRRRPVEDTLHEIVFTDAGTGWIVCERSIFAPMAKEESVSYLLKTSDGGESWTRVDVTRGEDVDIKLAGLRFADAGHGWVYGEQGVLYATSDGGRTWSRQRVPTRHLLLGGAFADAQHGWLSGGGLTLLRTEDGGENWRAGTLYIPISDPQNVSAPPRSNASSSGAAPRAAALPASLRLNAVFFAGSETGWAVGANGIIYSTANGGRSWQPQESGVKSDLYDVKFADALEGWAVGGEGTILHTKDGGRVWTRERRVTDHTLESLFFVGRGRAWAVGFGGTVVTFKG